MKSCLILMSGPPGAGKSTLARTVAKQLRAVVLDKDHIDEPFSPGDRGATYTRDVEPRVLQALLNLAEDNLSLGHPVILDVPWTHILLNSPAWRRKIRALCIRAGVKLFVFEIVIPEDLLLARLKKRGLSRDRVKLTPKGWDHFRKTDRLGAKNPFPHVVVNAEWSLPRATRMVLTQLRKTRS